MSTVHLNCGVGKFAIISFEVISITNESRGTNLLLVGWARVIVEISQTFSLQNTDLLNLESQTGTHLAGAGQMRRRKVFHVL